MDEVQDQEVQDQIDSLALLLEERGEEDPCGTARELVERARQEQEENAV